MPIRSMDQHGSKVHSTKRITPVWILKSSIMTAPWMNMQKQLIRDWRSLLAWHFRPGWQSLGLRQHMFGSRLINSWTSGDGRKGVRPLPVLVGNLHIYIYIFKSKKMYIYIYLNQKYIYIYTSTLNLEFQPGYSIKIHPHTSHISKPWWSVGWSSRPY